MLVVLVGRSELPDSLPFLALEPIRIRRHDGGRNPRADFVTPGCRGGPDSKWRPTRDRKLTEVATGMLGAVLEPPDSSGQEIGGDALQKYHSVGNRCGHARDLGPRCGNHDRNGAWTLKPRYSSPHAVLELDTAVAQKRFQVHHEPFQLRCSG